MLEPGQQRLLQAPVETICQATLAHPKADIGRSVLQTRRNQPCFLSQRHALALGSLARVR
jgi:hypothetical protein